jgi:hypothetical protein
MNGLRLLARRYTTNAATTAASNAAATELKGTFVQKFAELERRRKMNEVQDLAQEIKYLVPLESLDLYAIKPDYMELTGYCEWTDDFHNLRQEFEEKYQGVSNKIYVDNYYAQKHVFIQSVNQQIDKVEAERFGEAPCRERRIVTNSKRQRKTSL